MLCVQMVFAIGVKIWNLSTFQCLHDQNLSLLMRSVFWRHDLKASGIFCCTVRHSSFWAVTHPAWQLCFFCLPGLLTSHWSRGLLEDFDWHKTLTRMYSLSLEPENEWTLVPLGLLGPCCERSSRRRMKMLDKLTSSRLRRFIPGIWVWKEFGKDYAMHLWDSPPDRRESRSAEPTSGCRCLPSTWSW